MQYYTPRAKPNAQQQVARHTVAQANMSTAGQALTLQEQQELVIKDLHTGPQHNQDSLVCSRINDCLNLLVLAQQRPLQGRQQEVTEVMKHMYSLASDLNPNTIERLVAHKWFASFWSPHDQTIFGKHYQSWHSLLPQVNQMAQDKTNPSLCKELNNMLIQMSRLQQFCAKKMRQHVEADLVDEGAYEAIQALLKLKRHGKQATPDRVFDGVDLDALRKDLEDHQAVLRA